jgi:hypothetical protein
MWSIIAIGKFSHLTILRYDVDVGVGVEGGGDHRRRREKGVAS